VREFRRKQGTVKSASESQLRGQSAALGFSGDGGDDPMSRCEAAQAGPPTVGPERVDTGPGAARWQVSLSGMRT
jgi:hypothetical protein